jgi:hypothetical protein
MLRASARRGTGAQGFCSAALEDLRSRKTMSEGKSESGWHTGRASFWRVLAGIRRPFKTFETDSFTHVSPGVIDQKPHTDTPVFDFYHNLNHFYGALTEFCTLNNCPTMSAGST